MTNKTSSPRPTAGSPFMIMLIALLLGMLTTYYPAHAATLLPLPETTFFDANGDPLSSGTVTFYIPSTSTPKDTWKDSAGSMLNTNPIMLDAAGRAIIYGSGSYRQVVKDSLGNTIWDQVTTDTAATTGISWGGTSSGTPNAQTVSASGFTASAGSKLLFIAGFTNTGALTVNPNGTGGINVLKSTTVGAASLVGGEVAAGALIELDYDGTQLELINPVETPITGTLTDIASAATTSIGTLASHYANITGTTSITSLGAANVNAPLYIVKFQGALTLTYNASSLIIPGAQNIQTAAGDTALVEYLGASNWRVQAYNFASPPFAHPPQGRLTLTTGTPVMTADVTTAGSIFYTPYIGNEIPIYNGISFTPTAFSELTLTLSNPNHAINTNYDVFIAFNGTTLTACSGPAWTSDIGRGAGAGTTELERKFGIQANKNSVTCRNGASTFTVGADMGTYVGTFRTSGTAGDTLFTMNPAAAAGGGNARLYLWNAYNRVRVAATSKDSTDSWTYVTTTWRSLNNNTNNRISAVYGFAGDAITARLTGMGDSAAATGSVGVGLDSTTAYSGIPAIFAENGASPTMATAFYAGLPGDGFHFFQGLEIGNTGTSYGDNGVPLTSSMGLVYEGTY